MRIELIDDVKQVDGSVLYKGAQFNVTKDEKGNPCHGPYIDDKPGFVKVEMFGEVLTFFSQEFVLVPNEQ